MQPGIMSYVIVPSFSTLKRWKLGDVVQLYIHIMSKLNGFRIKEDYSNGYRLEPHFAILCCGFKPNLRVN